MLNNTPFDEITLDTLKDLITNEVMEGRQLDYKQELNLSTRDEKREFLKDVTAFANASGGYLVYGMKEGDGDNKGFPADVCGFTPQQGVEQLISVMENVIRDGVEKSLHGYRIRSLKAENGQDLIVTFVPSSVSKPHWISLYGHRRFYVRHETVSSPLDFDGLQRLFTLSESMAERIRDFRAVRIGNVLTGETPVVLKPGPKVVLHIVPFNTFTQFQRLDLPAISQPMIGNKIPRFHEFNHNFDGIYSGSRAEFGSYYYQVFRDGSIECVECPETNNQEEIYAPMMETFVSNECLPRFCEWYETLDVTPPYVFMLSLVNVCGYKLVSWSRASSPMTGRRVKGFHPDDNHHTIDKVSLPVPEVILSNFEQDPRELMTSLRPAFDVAWQSSGWPRSPGFDENGIWIGWQSSP